MILLTHCLFVCLSASLREEDKWKRWSTSLVRCTFHYQGVKKILNLLCSLCRNLGIVVIWQRQNYCEKPNPFQKSPSQWYQSLFSFLVVHQYVTSISHVIWIAGCDLKKKLMDSWGSLCKISFMITLAYKSCSWSLCILLRVFLSGSSCVPLWCLEMDLYFVLLSLLVC